MAAAEQRMHPSGRGLVIPCVVVGALLLSIAQSPAQPTAPASGQHPPDEAIAALHGIRPAEVARLRSYRNLTNADIAGMTTARVRRVLWRLDNPRPDQPLGAARYRMLLETGGAAVPPDGLAVALRQLEAAREEAERLPPLAVPGPRAAVPGAAPSVPQVPAVAGMPVGALPIPAPYGSARAAPPAGAPPVGGIDHDAGRLRLEMEPLPGLFVEELDARAAPQPRAAPGAADVQGLSPGRWRWLGPGNVGGRTRALVVHPSAHRVMWAGAVSGGIWKTTDGGGSWAPLADFLANLNVSTLALHPGSPNLLFAGTGEGFYNLDAFRGAGVFRTPDGGVRWEHLPATGGAEFHYVNRLAFNSGATRLFAATRSGLFVSTTFASADPAAVTFQPVQALAGRQVLDVKCHPADPQHCAASAWEGAVFVTTDGGATWRTPAGLPTWPPGGSLAGRVELAYARGAARVLYASVDRRQGEVYRSDDGGASFRLQGSPRHLGPQGWYDNAIWADDPTDPDLVVVGGLDLHRSEDGGQTFTKISAWQFQPASAHADHHGIVSHPGYDGGANRIAFFVNDGGVYRQDDIRRAADRRGWAALNNGYGVTQFYGAAGNPATGRIVGGTQDNGTVLYRPPPGPGTGPNGYVAMFGGDGGFSAADSTDPNFFYGQYVHLQIHRSINGGERSFYIYEGISDAGDRNNSLFIAPFILDPADQATMLAGGRSVWRSTDVRASTPAWEAIKPPASAQPNGLVSALDARRSPARGSGSSDRLWVGYADGQVFVSRDAHLASPSWTRVDRNGTRPLPARYVTRVRMRPDRPDTVFVSFGGYATENLWRSVDGGRSWAPTGRNLPSATVYDVAFHPADADLMYAATELGVFASSDGGATWFPTNQGPANVAVSELFWMGNRMVAATHGRGLFWIDLSPATVALVANAATAAPRAIMPIVPDNRPTEPAARALILPTDPANSR